MKNILKILSFIFLFFVKARIFLYNFGIFKSFKIKGIKIISIGNISFGGTGKTPVTIEIGQNLIEKKYKIAVLLRGYKRKGKAPLQLISDSKKILTDVYEAGDEAYLIANKLKCPVVVSTDRVKGAKFIKEKFNIDYILLDDAFQHLKLKRDKDIVIITQDDLKEGNYIFPYRYLREPISHLKRADLIIISKITNFKTIKKDILILKHNIKKEILLSKIILTGFYSPKKDKYLDKNFFLNKKCVIFCGIGNPDFFYIFLKNNGITITDKIFFRDHYKLKEKDYKKLNKIKNYPVITTEKDFVKLNLEKLEIDIFVALIKYNFQKFI